MACLPLASCACMRDSEEDIMHQVLERANSSLSYILSLDKACIGTFLQLVRLQLLDDGLARPDSVAHRRERRVRTEARGNDAVPAYVQVLEVVDAGVRVCHMRLRVETGPDSSVRVAGGIRQAETYPARTEPALGKHWGQGHPRSTIREEGDAHQDGARVRVP